MLIRQIPKYSLQYHSKKVLELGLILALGILILFFQAFKRFDRNIEKVDKVDVVINVDEIPQTEQEQRAPAPQRPSIPIESEDEDIPEDATIESTDIDLSELPPPPPPPEEEVDESAMVFIAYDEPPQPIGGFEAIQRNLRYPEIARKAGVEGRVVVNVLIDQNGNVIDTRILKSLGNNGCDEAAIAAIKSVKWKPAKQRDKPVKVWVGIPVVFMLK
ncbi:MAG TPA: energy transducer TonB [bacterium]|jgi:protein TonB|nr:energy transducer TonB [bacterium]HNT64260.1 energy transducer TonB [bacterium]HOX85250.1 energy transducer TonB [bacterium]HPG44409.1 energy transducer TonB [bacterium]HPM96967.1 energy transducer TonB [bacterium]